jgi:hypothetical protein
LTNEKKEINKKLDNLLEIQLVKGVDQRLIDKENQLKFRLQQIEKELENTETSTQDKSWIDVFLELQSDINSVPFKWKSEDPSIRNAFLKKYIDKIVYSRNIMNPDNPKLKIYYTDVVNQAMEVQKQYYKELAEKKEVKKAEKKQMATTGVVSFRGKNINKQDNE